MTALTANKDIPVKDEEVLETKVADNVHIYKGALVVFDTSGYLRPAADTEEYVFAGVAYEECDNTLTGHTAGGKTCRYVRRGVFKVTATSITQAMLGTMMYVADDATVDDSSTHKVPAGILVYYESSTSGWIDIAPATDAGKWTGKAVISHQIALANITAAGDVVTDMIPGFAGKIEKVYWVQGTPVTTASKAANLVVDVETTEVTGGLVELTSAACTPLGKVIAGSAVTAGNIFDADEKLSIRAEDVTAFVEGDGMLYIVCSVRGV